MKNIAIIPARSGSKGLKNKNIKLLNGKPLIFYTIQAAIKSGIFDEIMVSTDSEEYAKIAFENCANVPFLRDVELSNDVASSWDVVRDVIDKYKTIKNLNYDTVTLLQPTSPLRMYADIINAYNMLEQKNATSIISVCESDINPFYINTLKNDLCLNKFIDKNLVNTQRQSFDTYYKINGAIYMCLTKILDNVEDMLYDKSSFAYVMPAERSIDIDSLLDFKIAETILKEGLFVY